MANINGNPEWKNYIRGVVDKVTTGYSGVNNILQDIMNRLMWLKDNKSDVVDSTSQDKFANLAGVKKAHDKGVQAYNLANTKEPKITRSDAINLDSSNVVATSKAVKTAFDKANTMLPKSGGNMSGDITMNLGAGIRSTGNFGMYPLQNSSLNFSCIDGRIIFGYGQVGDVQAKEWIFASSQNSSIPTGIVKCGAIVADGKDLLDEKVYVLDRSVSPNYTFSLLSNFKDLYRYITISYSETNTGSLDVPPGCTSFENQRTFLISRIVDGEFNQIQTSEAIDLWFKLNGNSLVFYALGSSEKIGKVTLHN